MKILGNKIEKILDTNIDDFTIKVKFSDGVVGTISLDQFFQNPKGLVAEVLKGNMFDKCFIDSGALAWPNGLELCPDALKQLLEDQKKPKKKAA